MSPADPAAPDADRNLLFGVLALQADLLDPARFAEACSAWAARKDTPLADLLVERGWLTPEERSHVDFLLGRKLKKHGGDARAGLAEAAPESVRQTLAALDDPAVLQTLATLSAAGGVHGQRTVDYRPAGRDRYTLTRLHAEGGLGQVWLARDTDLGRDVALKELRAGRGGDATLAARFVEEAKITGQLEHPNIVPVYELARPDGDAGPFYTMRFIRGRTLAAAIKEYHRKRRADEAGPLELRELLGQFVAVCNAVAYAHSRGVLHRDLKPGNVVLGDYGEVIVLDWGLAKLQGAAEPRASLVPVSLGGDSGRAETMQGQVIGTPSYMPPEQAEGRLDRVDERSDVYALGAVLYETLTGEPPFDGPDTPSVLAQVVAGAPVPPGQKVKATPPALQAVCLKALAKKPADRYASAKELTQDVQRWLGDEPVTAWREPRLVQAGRWRRRHRQLLTGVTALLFAAVPLTLLLAANRQTALRQAEESERVIREQRDRAEAGEKTAKEREGESQAVLEFVENKVFAAARPETVPGGLGPQVTLRRAIEKALPFVEQSFRQQPLIEARLRMTLGKSFNYLGEPRIAADQFQAARAIYAARRGPDDPETLRSMYELAINYYDLGRFAEALRLEEETLALQTAKLGPDHPDTLRSITNVANSYGALGRQAEALELLKDTLALMKANLGPGHPDTLACMLNIARSYYRLGRRDEALKLEEETLAMMKATLGPDHSYTLTSMSNLALYYAASGRHAEALKLREETLALRKAKFSPDHPDTLKTMHNLAASYCELSRYAEALKLHEEALALQKAKFGPDHPDTLQGMYNFACTRALMISKAADRSKQADVAMETLKQAAAAGFKDIEQIKKDTDLDALRGRDDFKKLLAELEAGQAKGKK